MFEQSVINVGRRKIYIWHINLSVFSVLILTCCPEPVVGWIGRVMPTENNCFLGGFAKQVRPGEGLLSIRKISSHC